ncbi:hypothetical protein AgCh_003680 [Apium graveolens]
MMKLNDNFSVARGNVLMMEPITAISQAFRLFAQEEKHRELSSASQTESLAFIAEKRPYDNKSNFRGYSNASQSQRQPDISGHSLERYFKVHGYPPGFKFQERKVAAISQNQLSDSSSNTTDPVISTEQYNQLIQLLNNHQFPSQRQKVIPLGKIKAGLYSVDAQNHKVTLLDADKSHICNVACLSAIEDVKLWHLRLGHLPFQQMKLVLPSCNVQLCMKENICQFNTSIKTFRSDNAKEFIKGALKSFCESKGILQQSSIVYTPQQNGIPERKHRHLLETARALFFSQSSYKEASSNPLWIEAMNKEIHALQENKTWELVDLPKGKKAIGSKWVYKVKLKADGSLDRCKARLVAKGFNQKYGLDYLETFSPVVKMATIRTLLAVAASKQWSLFQLDVNNAFLHGDLHDEVYIRVPPGIPNPFNRVYRLIKSIYGLKQASREWFSKLLVELILQGFIQSKNDYSLFTKTSDSGICIAAVYVDDIILTGTDLLAIQSLKSHLHIVFGIKDLGKLYYFLGLEIGYLTDGIVVTQHKFTKELLSDCGLDLHKRVVTPLPVTLKLSTDSGTLFPDPELYRSLVGKLNFLTHTRPDLSFAVQTLSQFMHFPRSTHFEALHHTLRYVAHTVSQGILLKASSSLSLQAFSDSDWASCPDSRKSITGYLLLLGQSPITWKSKKQSTISKSSSEAEYRALACAAAEVTWLVRLLGDFGITDLTPVTLHCDNQSASHIAKNPVFHERTKHIEIDCHFTRDKVLEGLIQLAYLPTNAQLADFLTKSLHSPQFNLLLSKLGLIDSSNPNLRGGIGATTAAPHTSYAEDHAHQNILPYSSPTCHHMTAVKVS